MTIADRTSIVLLGLWGSQKEMMWLNKERKRKERMPPARGRAPFMYLRTNNYVVSCERLLDMILARDIPSSIP